VSLCGRMAHHRHTPPLGERRNGVAVGGTWNHCSAPRSRGGICNFDLLSLEVIHAAEEWAPLPAILSRGRALARHATVVRRQLWRDSAALAFDLADPFASDGERLADFFERVLAAVIQTKAHLDDFFFARRQRLQHRRRLFLQIQIDYRIGWRDYALSSMKSPRCGIFLFADRVSSEIGSCAIFRILRTLDTGMSMRLAISSLSARARVPARAGGWCVPIC